MLSCNISLSEQKQSSKRIIDMFLSTNLFNLCLLLFVWAKHTVFRDLTNVLNMFFFSKKHNNVTSQETPNHIKCGIFDDKYWGFLRHFKCNKCQTLRDGTAHWTLRVHYTFNDLDIISSSQQCQTVLTENLMWLSIKLKLCRVDKHIEQVINIPLFRTCTHIQGK